MIYDMTKRVHELWQFYDDLLNKKIYDISKASGVDASKMVKINPAEFIEKNKWQKIDGHEFKHIGKWIADTKTPDNYLISPLDEVEETANQISYKEKIDNIRIRASKCEVVPIHKEIALDFYDRNHRQSLPSIRDTALSFGLLYHGELVGCMTYDLSGGAVRGKKKEEMFELLRLAFRHNMSIAGGAGRLQKHCEKALIDIGEKRIFSYSNATINEGRVYAALGFERGKVDDGQPFAILRNNKLVRLITLHPNSTDKKLAESLRLKSHIGGNRIWFKDLKGVEE